MIDVATIAVTLLLLFTGCFFTVSTGFVQLFGVFGKKYKSKSRTANGSKVSPFMALATALGGSIGTANIAGVAGALAIGGAGSIFWLWISGLLGMATKYAEIKLAMTYRQRNSNGELRGGAMYYMERGVGSRKMAIAFSIFCVSGALFGGGMVQSNTIAESVAGALSAMSGQEHLTTVAISGVLTAVLCGVVIIGGVNSITKVATLFVPLASVLYVGASLAVIVANLDMLPNVLRNIVAQAFGFESVLGGTAGYGIVLAMKTGITRGTFSNEAGIGSAPMAHASSSETDPHRQAMLGVIEVFVDTIVICTLTALVILCSGIEIPYGNENASGMLIAAEAFATLLGQSFSGIFLCISVILFAVTSIIGWSLYGSQSVEYMLGDKWVKRYRLMLVVFIAFGAVVPVGTVWLFGEFSNLLMASVNVIAILVLSKQVGNGKDISRI